MLALSTPCMTVQHLIDESQHPSPCSPDFTVRSMSDISARCVDGYSNSSVERDVNDAIECTGLEEVTAGIR